MLPSDYGLIAMLSIFLAVAQTFVDSGFSNALIQKQDSTEKDFSTVFYFNIGVGFLCYLLLYMAAPFIAVFYAEPQLEIITKIVSLNVLIVSLGVVQRAKLSISLNFKLQAKASLIAVIAGGIIGVALAYRGYGAWALVMQSLLSNCLNVLLLWVGARWIPCRVFSWNSFRELFSFGSKLLLSGLLHTIYTNLYSLAIGKKMSSGDLGLYNRAYTLASLPSSNITDVLHKAMFPILCSLKDDKSLLDSFFLKYLRQACYLVFPLMIGLLVLASPLVEVLLTDKWIDAVPLVQILAFAYMWDPVMRLNNHLLYAYGRTDYTLKAEIIKKTVAFFILLLTIFYGLYIIAAGVFVYSGIDIFIITRYTRKVSSVKLKDEVKVILPILLLALSMGLLIWGVTCWIDVPVLKLVVGLCVGIIYYAFVSSLLSFQEFVFMKQFILKLKYKMMS